MLPEVLVGVWAAPVEGTRMMWLLAWKAFLSCVCRKSLDCISICMQMQIYVNAAFMAINLFVYLFHPSYRSCLPVFKLIPPNPQPNMFFFFFFFPAIEKWENKSSTCLKMMINCSFFFCAWSQTWNRESMRPGTSENLSTKPPSLYLEKIKSGCCREKREFSKRCLTTQRKVLYWIKSFWGLNDSFSLLHEHRGEIPLHCVRPEWFKLQCLICVCVNIEHRSPAPRAGSDSFRHCENIEPKILCIGQRTEERI